jgi:hypothetical protein
MNSELTPANPLPGIDILNCGTGHTEVRIDKSNPIELTRAKRIIADMLRRGYVLFIEGPDKALMRVEKFDEEHGIYIIADLGQPPDIEIIPSTAEATPMALSDPEPKPLPVGVKRGAGRPKKGIPMESVRATAIARTAGG